MWVSCAQTVIGKWCLQGKIQENRYIAMTLDLLKMYSFYLILFGLPKFDKFGRTLDES